MKSLLLILINFITISMFSQQSLDFKTKDAISFKMNDFSIKIIPLQTNDNCILGEIYQAQIEVNFFYLLDGATNTIFIFDKSGKYISKINAYGNGPGKYSNASEMQINPFNGQVEIADGYKNSIFKFTNKGKFISQKRIPFFFSSYEFLDKNTLVFDKSYQIDEKQSYNLLFTNNKYKVLKRISPISETPPSALSFPPQFGLKKINNKIWWLKAYDPIVYKVTSNGVSKQYRLDFGKLWPEHSFAFNNKLTDFKYIYNVFKKKYMIYFDFFPFKDYFFTKYTYQNVPYISIIDRKTNQKKLYNCSKLPKKFDSPVGYTDNAVIYMINPIDLLKKNFPLTEQQKQLINSYEDEPNPWIVLLQYKN